MSAFRRGLFDGKGVIVTGGASGIGLAIASDLVSLGARVLIASRNAENLSKAATELNELGACSSAVHILPTNIRKEDDVAQMINYATKCFGAPADALVNNAGGQFPAAAERITLKGWNAVLELNLTGTFLCSREFKRARSVAQLRGGSIVNITCDHMLGFPGMAHTGAARAGVDNLTKTLAMEWAADGLRVNAVAPGVIYSASAASNYPTESFLTDLACRIPFKRLGTPEEISSAVVFLLSDATASYITGTTLRVDGGCPLNGPVAWTIPNHDNAPAPPSPLVI